MTETVLGDAAPADYAGLPALLAQLGYPAEAESIAPRVQRVRDAGGRVIVARRDGAVVGLMALAFIPLIHHDHDLCRVSALVVAGHARSTGIGRRLMQLAEEIARERGCSRMEVTSAEHRYPAHAFYRNLGYTDRPRRFIKQLAPQGLAAPAPGGAHADSSVPEHIRLAAELLADAPAPRAIPPVPPAPPPPAPAPDAPEPAPAREQAPTP